MAVPTITSVTPSAGPAAGGDLVRVTGTDFAAAVEVLFDGVLATVESLRDEAGVSIADIRTPAHADGTVDVTVRNLDGSGVPVPGEEATLAAAYRFLRARIAEESNLTRIVRELLQRLRREVLDATSISVSVDYDDTVIDGVNVIALAQLPAVVLSGPSIDENRFFSSNVPHEDAVAGSAGPELLRRRPPFTVDLEFTITGASNRTVELLNLMAAVATFLNRTRWLELLRDPGDAAKGSVRWEMDPQGEYRTRLDGPDDVRAFTCGFVVRGFDIDEGLPLDLGKAVDTAELETETIAPALPGGGP